jgi:hypothetical protein
MENLPVAGLCRHEMVQYDGIAEANVSSENRTP